MTQTKSTKVEVLAFKLAVGALALAALVVVPASSRAHGSESGGHGAKTQGAPETLAQQVVRDTVELHRGRITAVELALLLEKGCSTVAATDPKEVGETCDSDDERPMRTGEPNVEEPTKQDPVYEVTQALHDESGRLIGVVSFDIQPQAGVDRAAVVAFAEAVLHELEARIPNKERLLESAASTAPGTP